MSTQIDIHLIPCLSDNYGFLAHDPETGACAAIDTPDADAILRALDETGWRLSDIWNTHHHYDHAGGNLALKEATGCRITGPRAEKDRIPGIDEALSDGDHVRLGALEARVLDVPGHTSGHIAYYLPACGVAFVGDTLFALGCGRLFEGTAAQMWDSLSKLTALPDETVVYCAHEYTEANARFAQSVEPENAALLRRMKDITAKRARGKPTIPTSIGLEKETNPFLRPHSAELRRVLGLAAASDVDVFAETRRRKDAF